MPGILALPGLLIAPKVSVIGMVAAPFLGCNVHLENESGKEADIGKAVKEAANTVAEAAGSAVKTVKEELEKAWNAVSADDPEGCPEGKENEEEPVEQNAPAEETPADEAPADEIPTVEAKPEDPEKK